MHALFRLKYEKNKNLTLCMQDVKNKRVGHSLKLPLKITTTIKLGMQQKNKQQY